MRSLALLFELADRAGNGRPIAESTELLEHAKQAAALCAYL
jgi:hypothetical protein